MSEKTRFTLAVAMLAGIFIKRPSLHALLISLTPPLICRDTPTVGTTYRGETRWTGAMLTTRRRRRRRRRGPSFLVAVSVSVCRVGREGEKRRKRRRRRRPNEVKSSSSSDAEERGRLLMLPHPHHFPVPGLSSPLGSRLRSPN